MKAFISAEVGRGKTYAACAIAIALVDDVRVRFVSLDDYLYELRSTYNSGESEADIIGHYANYSLLVVDDLGQSVPTKRSLTDTLDLIDRRYRKGFPTIYTSQYDSTSLANKLASQGDAKTADAIMSRLRECRSIVLTGTDRRASQGIAVLA